MRKHLDIVWTNQFKKDYKLAMKRHLDIALLDNIIRKLARGEELAEKNKDHALTGNWSGHRECHIQPDWLLVYRIENDLLVLRQHRTIHGRHICVQIISVYFTNFVSRERYSCFLNLLYLPKNLLTHLHHQNYAVLP